MGQGKRSSICGKLEAALARVGAEGQSNWLRVCEGGGGGEPGLCRELRLGRSLALPVGLCAKKLLEAVETLFDAPLQGSVAGGELVGVASEVEEELDHVLPVADVDVFGGDLLFVAIHVVVVAQGNADGGGNVAVDVVDGGFAGATGHERALVLEGLVALGEIVGLLGEEVGEGGV